MLDIRVLQTSIKKTGPSHVEACWSFTFGLKTKLFAKIGAKRQESASCTFFQFPISKKMSPDQVGDILLQSFKEINLKSNQVFGPGKNIFFSGKSSLTRVS